MKRHIGILLIVIAACMCASCVDDSTIPEFTKDERIHMSLGGKDVFVFDELICQLAFNRDRREFRAHTDNMSDYMVARFDMLPEHEDQEVTATIIWTTDTSVETKKNVTLKVVRLEGDKVWLWGKSSRVAMTIRILY